MLGSFFDLSGTVQQLAHRQDDDEQADKTKAATAGPECDAVDAHCLQLESEMIAMAQTLHMRNPKISVFCPICDSRMGVRQEHPISEFGALDVKLHRLGCSECGMETGRVFHALVGYDVSAP